MSDRNNFTETLHEVMEIIRTAPEPLTKDEILSYFKDIELTSEQEDMLINYLLTPHEEEMQTEEIPETTENEEPEEISKSLRMYREELANMNSYVDEEIQVMSEKLLDGDSDMIVALSNAFLPRIDALAQELCVAKVGMDDIIQEGNMAMFIRLGQLCGLGAESEYDVVEEVITEATEAMKSYISVETGEEDSENTIIGKANLVMEAQKILTNENGSEPTLEELAKYTNLDVDELKEILEFTK